MKKSRNLSFIVLAIVYIIASVVGVIIYKNLSFSWWLNLLIADVIATVVTFVFSLIFKNASVYDPYWSVQPIVIIIAFAIGRDMTVTRILPLIAIIYWGLRLTANWAYTFKSLEHEDWRYVMLHDTTGVFYPFINFIGIHMVPTLIVYACTLPAVFLFVNDTSFNAVSIIFFLVSIAAATIQGIADIQMHKYQKNRTTTFIRSGLWNHGRHPNYLGEISMWWGIGLYAFANSPSSIWLLTGALLNTILFFSVSIPMAEKKQSKKAGYAEYKKETRILI